MENIIKNVKAGETGGQVDESGFNRARRFAVEHEAKTGNRCAVVRVLDYADMFNGHRREHYSFDVVEIT